MVCIFVLSGRTELKDTFPECDACCGRLYMSTSTAMGVAILWESALILICYMLSAAELNMLWLGCTFVEA